VAEERQRRIDAPGELDAATDAVMGTDLPPAGQDRGTPGHDLARATARRAQAVRDRLGGLSYVEIAERHGYADKSAARNVVMRALDRVEARAVDELRDVENARLDLIQLSLTPILVSTGGRPADRIAAASALLRTSERRARLNGLDAPARLEVSAGAQAQLQDALAELRQVVLGTGEVVYVADDDEADAGAAG
jgi:hypothetical protein